MRIGRSKGGMRGGSGGRKGSGYNAFTYDELEAFKKQVEQLTEKDHEEIMKKAIRTVAARFLREAVKRTPVGNYNDGRVGGTLRRGWTTGDQKTAMYSALFGGSTDYNGTLDNIKVEKHGNKYVVEIVNNVEYASYVNYGHRTRGGNGWVEGRFFMEIAAEKVEAKKDYDVEMTVLKYLKEAFG